MMMTNGVDRGPLAAAPSTVLIITPALLSFVVTLLNAVAVLVVGGGVTIEGGMVSQREALTMTMTGMTLLHIFKGGARCKRARR